MPVSELSHAASFTGVPSTGTAQVSVSWSTSASPNAAVRYAPVRAVISQYAKPQRARLDILGEGFVVHSDQGEIMISHPTWSLFGAGHTLADARFMLTAEAARFAEALANDPPDILSDEASRLRAFVLRLTGLK